MNFQGRCGAISILAMIVCVTIILCVSPTDCTLTCRDVFKDLRPCVTYIQFGSGMPPAACCNGVSMLASATNSDEDKRAVCECIKSAALKGVGDLQLAKDLPKNCGIRGLPFEISLTMDCSRIS